MCSFSPGYKIKQAVFYVLEDSCRCITAAKKTSKVTATVAVVVTPAATQEQKGNLNIEQKANFNMIPSRLRLEPVLLPGRPRLAPSPEEFLPTRQDFTTEAQSTASSSANSDFELPRIRGGSAL